MIQFFLKMPRWTKRAISIIYDALAIYLSFIAAWALRVGNVNYEYSHLDQFSVAIAACASILLFIRLGLYRAILRYVTHEAFITIAVGVTLSSLIMAATSFMIGGNMPRSVPIIYGCIAFIAVGTPRILFRSLLHWLNPRNKPNVIIYGAGESGNHLAAALQSGTEYNPIAFIDDNPKLQHSSIRGISVFHPGQLDNLIEKYEAKKILLATGNPNKRDLAKLIQKLSAHGIPIATIPKMVDLIKQRAEITQLREIQISDILGREPVEPVQELLRKNITSKTVLVTGAAGSIGSELCRQIIKLNPSKLILLDNSEFGLYKLNEQLEANGVTGNHILPVLGDVRNTKCIDDTLLRHKPNTIYHAAAYKHVPIVESNTWEGIRNNTQGTYIVAQSAVKHEVEQFVLISTDKAVRPTNVMGATKRFAELIIKYMQASPENKNTNFAAVRFGNVLDSSGSVLPKFRQQIAKGGPLTVTHPDVTRYFMTLQEAAQLVIQAGAMSKGGDIFVLDMGDPVKINELAKNMLSLAAANGADTSNISIEITGLRPGEKLYEELLINRQCLGTEHSRIWLDVDNKFNQKRLTRLVSIFIDAINENDVVTLERLIMSDHTDYRVLSASIQLDAVTSSSNVVAFK